MIIFTSYHQRRVLSVVREDNTSAPGAVCFKLSSRKPPPLTDGSEGARFGFVSRMWVFGKLPIFNTVALKQMHWSSCFDLSGFTAKSWGGSNEETSSPLPQPESCLRGRGGDRGVFVALSVPTSENTSSAFSQHRRTHRYAQAWTGNVQKNFITTIL